MIKTFGNTLKSSREAKGYSLRQLSELVGVSPGYLSDLESGRRINPSVKILGVLETALGVTLHVPEGVPVPKDVSADIQHLVEIAVELPEAKLQELIDYAERMGACVLNEDLRSY